MGQRYEIYQSETSKEAKRRKISPDDLAALVKRAEGWAHVGGPGREGVKRRAATAFELYLDFLRAGVLGLDFPRWLSRHSGVPVTTCWRYLKAGESQDVNREQGKGENWNQSGLLAEQLERQRTPGPEVDWEED